MATPSTKSDAKSKPGGPGDGDPQGPVLDVLRALLAEGRSDEVIALVTALVDRNSQLELLLAKVRNSKNRGEHISREQLDLFLEALRDSSAPSPSEADEALHKAAEENAGRPERTKPEKQPPVRRPPPAHLPRIDNPIAVPDEERPCPTCGAQRRCIAHEITEVIDLEPAKVFVRRDIKEVLACNDCDGEMVRAPMGDKVVAGGAYGSTLVADLIVSKYQDGLPLNRQMQRLARLGLEMPSSSMSDQIIWGTDLLAPIWRALAARVLAAGVMHVDGTSLPVRDREGPKGIVTGALWGYVGDTDCAVYLYTSTGKKRGQREGELGPQDFLALRTGPVVADAANLFDASFADGSRIEVGCSMHARRYFVKALEAGDLRAALPVEAFKSLYDVEATASEWSCEERRFIRQERSRPVYEQLIDWCKTYQPSEPPSSLLGKAIQYLLNHQVALTRFLEDGLLPIDNGIVERLHRRPALTRAAYLFAGSHAAAKRAAVAYSILGTCTIVGVNPSEYLADVLPRLARGVTIATDIPRMLPAAWKAERAAAAPAT